MWGSRDFTSLTAAIVVAASWGLANSYVVLDCAGVAERAG